MLKKYELVVCSSSVDDNIQGQKYNCAFTNIVEHDWNEIYERAVTTETVFVHNGERENLLQLILFLNTYNIKHSFMTNYPFHISQNDDRIILDNDLVFVGCSHTAGKGHSTNVTTFPIMVAEKLKYNPIVYGFPGKGNYLFEEIIYGLNLNNKKLVIQYTDISRIRYNGNDKRAMEYTRGDMIYNTEEHLSSIFIEQNKRICKYLRAINCQFVFLWLANKCHYYDDILTILSDNNHFVYVPDFNVDVGDLGHHFGPKSHENIANAIVKKWYRLNV